MITVHIYIDGFKCASRDYPVVPRVGEKILVMGSHARIESVDWIDSGKNPIDYMSRPAINLYAVSIST
jgi:hypothetical protein